MKTRVKPAAAGVDELVIPACVPGFVYLLHFAGELGSERHHARHYMGWARDWRRRVEQHRRGGAVCAFTRAAFEANIPFDVALVFVGSRDDERKCKRAHHHARLCPYCNALKGTTDA